MRVRINPVCYILILPFCFEAEVLCGESGDEAMHVVKEHAGI